MSFTYVESQADGAARPGRNQVLVQDILFMGASPSACRTGFSLPRHAACTRPPLADPGRNLVELDPLTHVCARSLFPSCSLSRAHSLSYPPLLASPFRPGPPHPNQVAPGKTIAFAVDAYTEQPGVCEGNVVISREEGGEPIHTIPALFHIVSAR